MNSLHQCSTSALAGMTGEGTPSSNTGLNSQSLGRSLTCRVDTCSFVLRSVPDLATAYQVISGFEALFHERVEFRPELSVTNGKRYAGSTKTSVRGLRFWWNWPEHGDDGELLVYIPGQCFRQCTDSEARELIGLYYHQYGGEFTRVDIALDDWEKRISFETVASAIESGNYARFRRAHEYRGLGSDTDGHTLYMGSPQSDKFVRYYDKYAESGGELDCYRWEVQFRRGKANAAGWNWLQLPLDDEVNAAQELAAHVTGAVHFCDREAGDKNIDRCPLLPWWAALLSGIRDGIRLSSPKRKPLLDRSLRWLQEQVAPTLAVVREVFEDGFETLLQGLLDEGKSRFGSRHRGLILDAIAGH